MERIGLTASKIAKGNLLIYNICVVFLSLVFSFLLLIMAGSAILLGLVVLGYLMNGILSPGFSQDWLAIVRFCMVALSGVIGVICVIAILRNIKIKRD